MTIKISLKRPDQKESGLIVRFSMNGIAYKFYPGKSIQTKNWSVKKQSVLSGEENSQLINDYLDTYQSELKRIIAQFEADQMSFDKDKIQTELDKAFNKNTTNKEDFDFIAFYDDFLEKNTHLKSINNLKRTRDFVIYSQSLISKSQFTAYENSPVRHRAKFVWDVKKLPFAKIDKSFMEQFSTYLHTTKFNKTIRGVKCEVNYAKNFIGKSIKNLRQIVNEAIEAEYVLPFSLKKFKSSFEEVDTCYTNIDEIQLFSNLTLTDPREILIRDKYVANCFLGMRYSDFNQLKKHHFQKRTIDGSEQVVYAGRQIKTDKRVEFPLHSNAVRILEKYSYEMDSVPAIEFNTTIKVIAEKAGLTGLFRKRETRGNRETIFHDIPKYFLISSHTCRRSFCTIFHQMGWDISSIMAVSGHKTEAEFRKYVKAEVRLEVLANQLSKIPDLKAPLLKVA